MKVTVTKRYCYSQSYRWSGGFAKALQDVQKRREEHPDSEVSLEINERSTERIYRVVRYTPFEFEVPEMPAEAEFDIPKFPKAKKLKPHEYVQSIEETEVEDIWYPARMRIERKLVLKHSATDTTVKYHLYSGGVNKYVFANALHELERKVDSTYAERMSQYKEKQAIYDQALAEWREKVDALYAEAKKEVVTA